MPRNYSHDDDDDHHAMSDEDSDQGGALSSDEDEEVAHERLTRRLARKEQKHLENLYGSFLDDDDDEDVGRYRKRQSNNNRGFSFAKKSTSSSSSAAPVFVKTTRADEDVLPEARPQSTTPLQAAIPVMAPPQPHDISIPAVPDEEELARQRDMEEKNRRFLELLQKGKGLKQATIATRIIPASQPTETTTRMSSSSDSAAAAAAPTFTPGLGLGAVPQQFGGLGRPSAKKLVAPKLATWEKHTKGIGSKLLAKMGYTGEGGLSKRKLIVPVQAETMQEATETTQPTSAAAAPVVVEIKGIAKPIQVKVRPSGLGLGFGNFKEASSLKENKQIEAQVRGLDVDDNEHDDIDDTKRPATSRASAGKSSALPTVKDLLKDQTWRRGANKSQKRKREVVPYTELLETRADKQVIIDMRGPSHDELGGDELTSGQAPLGVELLHNVTLLLNTYENKLYSSSSFVESSKRKLSSIESDIQSIQERRHSVQERIQKLERVRTILSKIDDLSDSTLENGESAVASLKGLVTELSNTFTQQEKADLKFSEVLLPALLASFVESQILNRWKPLKDPLDRSKHIIDSVLEIAMVADNGNKAEAIRRLLTSSILPKIKAVLTSHRWDPMCDMDMALDLYDALTSSLANIEQLLRSENRNMNNNENAVFGSSSLDQDETHELLEISREVLVRDVIYSKLTTSLGRWKPELEDDGLRNRLDRWIIPWLPHLDHEALLPRLVTECKRKVRDAIAYLQRKVSSDEECVSLVIDTLHPWRGVLKERTIHDIVSAFVSQRLARALKTTEVGLNVSVFNWSLVFSIFRMNELRLLHDLEFLALIEGEILWPWCQFVHGWLTSGKAASSVIESYIAVKLHLLQGVGELFDLSFSRQRLFEDDIVCRCLYSVLTMLQSAKNSDLDHLALISPGQSNFRTALTRRTKDEKRRIADDIARMDAGIVGISDVDMEARIRLKSSRQTPTFREVVEELAIERSIEFQPKSGSNATKDGKPVYMFGGVPIYFDSDVVFALDTSGWAPVSIQRLLDRIGV